MLAAPNTKGYRPSFKTKRKNKSRLYTINSEGTKYACLTNPFNKVNDATCRTLLFDPTKLENYKRYIERSILDADEPTFKRKIETYGYNDCSVYTWILKSGDEEKPTLKAVTLDTPVKLYMVKVQSLQEIGTTHYNLDKFHPETTPNQMPVIGAGELRVTSPRDVIFNLLSGTFMAKKILKNVSNIEKKVIETKIITLLKKKLREKGFEADYIENADLIEGTCFVVPKETMNTVRGFFKNTTRKPNNAAKTRKNTKR